MEGGGIIHEWLRRLNLECYTQDFLDNGYDDLEVCKQIGQPDLDAIGVEDPAHRRDILEAVGFLHDQGNPAVYFTLENPDYEKEDGDLGRRRISPRSYSALQLTVLIREKLVQDEINLSEEPCLGENGQQNLEFLNHLASRYSLELNAKSDDVLERLLELQSAALSVDDAVGSPEKDADHESPSKGMYKMFSIYGQSPRSAPHPPLPPVPHNSLVSYTYVDPIELDMDSKFSCQASRQNLMSSPSIDSENQEMPGSFWDGGIKGSVSNTIGRFFKHVSLRRSAKKYSYKQHKGDLNASEITMSEDERIQLMILVKEGKLSIHDAVEMVKNYPKPVQPKETDTDSQDKRVPSATSVLSSPHRQTSKSSTSQDSCKDRLKIFSSPFSLRKFQAKDYESLTNTILPQQRPRGLSELPNLKYHYRRWSPPPLPPLPRGSGAIVESMSAEFLLQRHGSLLGRFPLPSNTENGHGVTVRKSHSLHASAMNQNDGLHENGHAFRNHFYENLSYSNPEHYTPLLKSGSDLICTTDDTMKKHQRDAYHDPDATLTNDVGKKCRKLSLEKPVFQSMTRVHRLHLASETKDPNEIDDGKTMEDSLIGATGFSGVSSSSSHSSMMSVDLEPDCSPSLRLPHALNRARANLPGRPDTGHGITTNPAGMLRSADVELMTDETTLLATSRQGRTGIRVRKTQRRPKPKTVEELLSRLGLQHLAVFFVGHGVFNTLEEFSEIDEVDLDELHIVNQEERVKLLTAAQLLQDYENNESDSPFKFSCTDISYSRSASQSPALSHDASSQTILTSISSPKEKSKGSAINEKEFGQISDPPASSRDLPYLSETSSDDQEVISITKNGAIMISWADGRMSAATSMNGAEPVCSQSNGSPNGRQRSESLHRVAQRPYSHHSHGSRMEMLGAQRGDLQMPKSANTLSESRSDGFNEKNCNRTSSDLSLVNASPAKSPSIVKTAQVRQLSQTSPVFTFDEYVTSGTSSAMHQKMALKQRKEDQAQSTDFDNKSIQTSNIALDSNSHSISLNNFLASIGLSIYTSRFIEQGVTCVGDLRHVTANDLKKIGLTKSHIIMFLNVLENQTAQLNDSTTVNDSSIIHHPDSATSSIPGPTESENVARSQTGTDETQSASKQKTMKVLKILDKV